MEKVLDRRVTATVDGETRKVPLTEALVLQLVQKALKGDVGASRELMRVMTQLDLNAPADDKSRQTVIVRWMVDPEDCNPALAALNVVTDVGGRYKIEPWVVEAAAARGVKINDSDKTLVANSTRNRGEREAKKQAPMPLQRTGRGA